jgi:hypothetical protein
MLAKLTLHTLLAATLVAGVALAWQARDEGFSAAAASLAGVLGHEIGFGEDDGKGDVP